METSATALMHGMSAPSTFDFSAIPEEMKKLCQWVLYRIEGERKAKVPYRPNGKRADVTKPKTWSSYEKVVSVYNAGGFDGIGFVFTEDDPYCGIDLDHCRKPGTGEIEPWAWKIIDDLKTYTEASPSGTGVHAIARASVPSSQRVAGTEIYNCERFFTMTGEHVENTPVTIEYAPQAITQLWDALVALKGGPSGKAVIVAEDAIDWHADPESIRDRLDKILASDPQFRRTWEHDRQDLLDQSLSSYDLSLEAQAVLTHGWYDPTDLYLLLRLHHEEYGGPEDKKKSKRRDYVRRTVGLALAGSEDRVLIRVKPGSLPTVTKKAAAALGRATALAPFDGIYLYGDQSIKVTGRGGGSKVRQPGSNRSQRIVRADQEVIEHELEAVCQFVRYSKVSSQWMRADVPAEVARRLLARGASWPEIPVLTGIVEAPTLRPDGTVLDQPGYDPESGLLFDPGGVEFPAVPESPTHEDALAALDKLMRLLTYFSFVDKSSVSVALSGIMTPLVRHACRAVPMHAVTAPRPSSGKTMIAGLGCCILTGEEPEPMSQAEGAAEERKRLVAVLMAGLPVVLIDNIDRELKSDALCTILTEPYYSDRLLGVSQTGRVPSRATFLATGNNLAIAGDLTTRTVVCALDPGCERPEERHFDFDPREEARKRRDELAVAVLTIVQAHRAAGSPRPKVPNFARFEDWCDVVRYPLIWLGMADPCEGREWIEGRDPVREQLTALLQAWHDLFGLKPVKVKDAITEVTHGGESGASDDKSEARSSLREVLIDVAGQSGKLSPTALGKFISRYENRIEGGLRFENAGKAKRAVLWLVKLMDDHSLAPSKGEVGDLVEVVAKAQADESEEEFTIEKKGNMTIKRRKKKVPMPEQPNFPDEAVDCPTECDSGDLAKASTPATEWVDHDDL